MGRNPNFWSLKFCPRQASFGIHSETRRKRGLNLRSRCTIHSRSSGLLKGRTLDFSGIGIAAMLDEDIPVGEVVKLSNPLPSGPMMIYATGPPKRLLFSAMALSSRISDSVRETLRARFRGLAVQQSAPAHLDDPGKAGWDRRARAHRARRRQMFLDCSLSKRS